MLRHPILAINHLGTHAPPVVRALLLRLGSSLGEWPWLLEVKLRPNWQELNGIVLGQVPQIGVPQIVSLATISVVNLNLGGLHQSLSNGFALLQLQLDVALVEACEQIVAKLLVFLFVPARAEPVVSAEDRLEWQGSLVCLDFSAKVSNLRSLADVSVEMEFVISPVGVQWFSDDGIAGVGPLVVRGKDVVLDTSLGVGA